MFHASPRPAPTALAEDAAASSREDAPSTEKKNDPLGFESTRTADGFEATYLDRAVMAYEQYRFVLCFENSRASG